MGQGGSSFNETLSEGEKTSKKLSQFVFRIIFGFSEKNPLIFDYMVDRSTLTNRCQTVFFRNNFFYYFLKFETKLSMKGIFFCKIR